jgi:hypothetical protein
MKGDQNWHKKSKYIFDWRAKLKRIITFTKESRKNIRNQNNKDQIEKFNTINLY